EQHQRVLAHVVRDEVDVGDVRREGRQALLDRLIVADVGEDGVEDGKFGAISASRPMVFRATVLPPVLGPLITTCRCPGGSTLSPTDGDEDGAPESSSMVSGTTEAPRAFNVRSSSGWRAWRRMRASGEVPLIPTGGMSGAPPESSSFTATQS